MLGSSIATYVTTSIHVTNIARMVAHAIFRAILVTYDKLRVSVQRDSQATDVKVVAYVYPVRVLTAVRVTI